MCLPTIQVVQPATECSIWLSLTFRQSYYSKRGPPAATTTCMHACMGLSLLLPEQSKRERSFLRQVFEHPRIHSQTLNERESYLHSERAQTTLVQLVHCTVKVRFNAVGHRGFGLKLRSVKWRLKCTVWISLFFVGRSIK